MNAESGRIVPFDEKFLNRLADHDRPLPQFMDYLSVTDFLNDSRVALLHKPEQKRKRPQLVERVSSVRPGELLPDQTSLAGTPKIPCSDVDADVKLGKEKGYGIRSPSRRYRPREKPDLMEDAGFVFERNRLRAMSSSLPAYRRLMETARGNIVTVPNPDGDGLDWTTTGVDVAPGSPRMKEVEVTRREWDMVARKMRMEKVAYQLPGEVFIPAAPPAFVAATTGARALEGLGDLAEEEEEEDEEGMEMGNVFSSGETGGESEEDAEMSELEL